MFLCWQFGKFPTIVISAVTMVEEGSSTSIFITCTVYTSLLYILCSYNVFSRRFVFLNYFLINKWSVINSVRPSIELWCKWEVGRAREKRLSASLSFSSALPASKVYPYFDRCTAKSWTIYFRTLPLYSVFIRIITLVS